MQALKTLISWGWSPILITGLAIAGYVSEVDVWVMGPILIIILITGLVTAVYGAKEREMEHASQRLNQLAGYFNRRFMGSSSLSIFAIIDSLFNIDKPEVWEWARACDMSRRVFDTWCHSFINRVESDIRTRRFDVYLRTYLNELWLINSHYYEFIEQFYEIAKNIQLPHETVEQYNRLVLEYNAFVQNFRDNISGLKRVAKTEIEPPSIKLANELPAQKP